MRALFVYNPVDLDSQIPGGVQRCTREFLNVVTAAADVTIPFEVTYDKRLSTRLKRRSRLFPYEQYNPNAYRNALLQAISQNRVDTVFFNRAELMRFVPVLAAATNELRLALMSHGNESGDLLYDMAVYRRDQHRNLLRRAYDYLWLGGDLAAEAHIRHENRFTVVAMSKEEAVLERWLGAQDVFVLPRCVTVAHTTWAPAAMRVGYVGSLHHTPNIVALEAVLDLLQARASEIVVDIVGYPDQIGARLAAQYRHVRYLGPLDDNELTAAATEWSLFINPIFWLSKGASMKFGDALSRGLPVLTTRAGSRGYELPDDCYFVSEDRPENFVERLVSLADDMSALIEVRKRLFDTAKEFPNAEILGLRLRKHIVTLLDGKQ